MNKRQPRNYLGILLILSFCSVIFLPGPLMVLMEEQTYSQTEKRMLEEFPPLPASIGDLSRFRDDLTAYLNDHFGLREFLVYRYQREVRKRFDVIGNEVDVLRGLNNYYYYTGFHMLDDFLGRLVLSHKELRQWREHYAAKEQWLGERGIEYLLVTAPSKYSIYPEHVTQEWQQVRGQSRLQQLENHLATEGEPPFTFVNLVPRLLAAKENEYLYHKSDTHWAPLGAYHGYLGIAEAVEQKLPELVFRKDFTFSREISRYCSPTGNRCGDLTQMLLDFKPFEEPFRVVDNHPVCSTKEPLALALSDLKESLDPPNIDAICPQQEHTAVVFHDSFFVSIRPFLSENFGRVIYLWKLYDQQNIEEILEIFKPDIVIEERFERKLYEGI
jgi:hypothetical protein